MTTFGKSNLNVFLQALRFMKSFPTPYLKALNVLQKNSVLHANKPCKDFSLSTAQII